MAVIIAFDPGITTGVAICDTDLQTLNAFETKVPENFILPGTTVVVERMPYGLNQAAMAIACRATLAGCKVVWISPGEWKPLRHLLASRKTARGQHAKDAAAILQYYLDFKR